jgi:hypothetical protein
MIQLVTVFALVQEHTLKLPQGNATHHVVALVQHHIWITQHIGVWLNVQPNHFIMLITPPGCVLWYVHQVPTSKTKHNHACHSVLLYGNSMPIFLMESV